jgi:hypothetical protein
MSKYYPEQFVLALAACKRDHKNSWNNRPLDKHSSYLVDISTIFSPWHQRLQINTIYQNEEGHKGHKSCMLE